MMRGVEYRALLRILQMPFSLKGGEVVKNDDWEW
jgi:hypothetical protein